MNQRKMNDVPIIDINQDRQTAVAEISKACTQWGFFKISNHGISEKLIDNLVKSFEKPFKDKKKNKSKNIFSHTRSGEIRQFESELDNKVLSIANNKLEEVIDYWKFKK